MRSRAVCEAARHVTFTRSDECIRPVCGRSGHKARVKAAVPLLLAANLADMSESPWLASVGGWAACCPARIQQLISPASCGGQCPLQLLMWVQLALDIWPHMTGWLRGLAQPGTAGDFIIVYGVCGYDSNNGCLWKVLLLLSSCQGTACLLGGMHVCCYGC
jgi:hypothetical protein